MAGEVLERAFLNSYGLENDRLYAFESSGAPPGMLRLTGPERRRMLQYRARLSGIGDAEVVVPSGESYRVDSPEFLGYLQSKNDQDSRLKLSLAETPQTDVRPLSLLSMQTVQALSSEFGRELEVERFRANLLVDLDGGAFTEDQLVGRSVAIGSEARLLIRERTPRCRFITYAPEAPWEDPLFPLMKLLDRSHQGRVGVYASVIVPGWIRGGDDLVA
jgi:uncharacterized protein YcbX